MPKPATEFAPAKINLCLHVTGQRADGYHLLDSLVVFCGAGDRVEASLSDHLSLKLEGPFADGLPLGEDNLVLRAARCFGTNATFTLEKNLPPSSGIGGGSADAAAAIRALQQLTGTPGPEPAEILALGADLPVCLASRPARMRGIGEELSPVPALPEAHLLLVNPRVEVPTPAVFRALARRDNPGLPEALPDWPDCGALADWLAQQRNDLEAPALSVVPVIGKVLDRLRGLPQVLLARMSGSGATCFALFARAEEAEAGAKTIRAAHPEWWVAPCPVLR
jgi:4-diphosphocytidyl-2-C-methyl-D-erythritol kinase